MMNGVSGGGGGSPPTVIHSKARKSLALIKHPPYFEMISAAIVTLKERNGSSQYAIGEFIQDKHKDLPANFKKQLLNQLKKLVASHKLVKVKGSYKLPSKTKPAPAIAKPKKKPAATKPVTKKAPAKKKPAAPEKTKAAPKAKPAKAKPATKAKPAVKGAAKVARTSTRSMPGKKVPAKVAPKKSGRLITLEEIIKHFGKPMEAAILRASRATLKGLCRSFGVSSWPYETDKNRSTYISMFLPKIDR